MLEGSCLPLTFNLKRLLSILYYFTHSHLDREKTLAMGDMGSYALPESHKDVSPQRSTQFDDHQLIALPAHAQVLSGDGFRDCCYNGFPMLLPSYQIRI